MISIQESLKSIFQPQSFLGQTALAGGIGAGLLGLVALSNGGEFPDHSVDDESMTGLSHHPTNQVITYNQDVETPHHYKSITISSTHPGNETVRIRDAWEADGHSPNSYAWVKNSSSGSMYQDKYDLVSNKKLGGFDFIPKK